MGRSVVRLTGGWLGPHNRLYYAHHDDSIRRVDPDWFRDRLNCEEAGDWFDRAALNALLREHLAGTADHSIRINNVVSFLAWRRMMGV